MKGIIFSGDPLFGDDVKLLVLSPAGVRYDAQQLGDHFYGSGTWDFVTPPMRRRAPRRVPQELLATPLFRFPSVGMEWSDFLEDIYDSVDFVLFLNHETGQLHEVSQASLTERRPENFAFTFFDISRKQHLNARRNIMGDDKLGAAAGILAALMADGWSVAAIAKESGVNQITLGNIKNRKAGRITDKVFERIEAFRERAASGDVQKPSRGRSSAPAAAQTRKTAAPVKKAQVAQSSMSLINTDYVSVDITQLQSVIDRLIGNFSDAISELESIRGMLRR